MLRQAVGGGEVERGTSSARRLFAVAASTIDLGEVAPRDHLDDGEPIGSASRSASRNARRAPSRSSSWSRDLPRTRSRPVRARGSCSERVSARPSRDFQPRRADRERQPACCEQYHSARSNAPSESSTTDVVLDEAHEVASLPSVRRRYATQAAAATTARGLDRSVLSGSRRVQSCNVVGVRGRTKSHRSPRSARPPLGIATGEVVSYCIMGRPLACSQAAAGGGAPRRRATGCSRSHSANREW